MILFYSLLGVFWSVMGIFTHGDTSLIEFAIGAVYLVASTILSRLKERA